MDMFEPSAAKNIREQKMGYKVVCICGCLTLEFTKGHQYVLFPVNVILALSVV